jgi:cell division protein FtsW (lipid II flippase)
MVNSALTPPRSRLRMRALTRLAAGLLALIWALVGLALFLGHLSEYQDELGCMAGHPVFAIAQGLVALVGVTAAVVAVVRLRLRAWLIAAGCLAAWIAVLALAAPGAQSVGRLVC